MDFDTAFERLIGHEGGYVDHPMDPGRETKFGITKRSYPHLDIKNLTLDQAKAIYRKDYWVVAGCDVVPDKIRFDLFDMAVNSGVKVSVRTMQRAVGATPDGIIGPETLRCIRQTHPAVAAARFNGFRLEFMANLPIWDHFSEGWAKRIAKNLQEIS